jgi:hypothetical protein
LQRRALQKAGAHIVARSEQNLRFLPQRSISAAGSIQKGRALLRGQFERFPNRSQTCRQRSRVMSVKLAMWP